MTCPRCLPAPTPVVLTADDLPTDVDLALVHWGIDLALRGGRTIEEARETERLSGGMVRSSFERQADGRTV